MNCPICGYMQPTPFACTRCGRKIGEIYDLTGKLYSDHFFGSPHHLQTVLEDARKNHQFCHMCGKKGSLCTC